MTANILKSIERFCYKWLPIIMGCHCRADRSFFYKGRQFPVCARCTGILCGMLAGIVIAFFVMPRLWLCILLALPAIIDGAYQKASGRESTNLRRLITGVFLGYALINLIFKLVSHGFRTGLELGQRIIEKQ